MCPYCRALHNLREIIRMTARCIPARWLPRALNAAESQAPEFAIRGRQTRRSPAGDHADNGT
jgi:hypothetical protein